MINLNIVCNLWLKKKKLNGHGNNFNIDTNSLETLKKISTLYLNWF